MNKVQLLGRIASDYTHAFDTKNKKPMLTFLFAITSIRSKPGNNIVKISVYEKKIPLMEKFFKRGDRMVIVGRLNGHIQPGADGKTSRLNTTIVADEVYFAETLSDKTKVEKAFEDNLATVNDMFGEANAPLDDDVELF